MRVIMETSVTTSDAAAPLRQDARYSDTSRHTASDDPVHVINQRIFDTSVDLILVADRRGTIMRVSPSSAAILGYAPEKMIGRSAKEFLYPEDLDNTRNEMRLARLGRTTRNFECRYVHREGHAVPIEWTGVWSEKEQLHFFIGRDVTAVKAARLALSEAHAELSAIVAASPVAILMLDRDGRVKLWSASAERVFGYSEAAALDQLPPYLTEEHLADFHANVAHTLNDPAATGALETQRRRRDGKIIDVSVRWARVNGDDGRMLGTMYAIADVTEGKKIEAQLHHAQKMEAIGNLTGGMAHDFNNHLAIIIGNLDVLRETRGFEPHEAELLQDALDAALNGAELTRRLLAFARRQPLRPQAIEANALIANITRLLARTLGENIAIELQLDPAIPSVLADSAQLETAIANLANNARDAMPGGGRLTIATKTDILDAAYAAEHNDVESGRYVVVEVSDTGTGMPPEIVARIFEPFYTTKAPGSGTGLGLSMVFGFLKQSGGHINVYSEPGRGTVFRLYLRPAERALVAAAGADLAPSAGRGETILVVEDNTKLRRVVAAQLTGLGYRIIEAENACDALVALDRAAAVDLLFSDIVMPGEMDGSALACEAVARRPGLHVLLTSGFPGSLAIKDAMSGRNARLLSKPYRMSELARAIREVLDEGTTAAVREALLME
jgi:PAS domain S-box-containing protein